MNEQITEEDKARLRLETERAVSFRRENGRLLEAYKFAKTDEESSMYMELLLRKLER